MKMALGEEFPDDELIFQIQNIKENGFNKEYIPKSELRRELEQCQLNLQMEKCTEC